MPAAPRYTDTVVSILTDNLGPDALTELARARSHLNPAPDPIRAALAQRLHTAARETSRLEGDLREHMRRLQDFLARAQDDLTLARTPSRWEVIGVSGTAIDQAVARFGDALGCLNADAYLYAEIGKHLSAPPSDPDTPRPEPDTDRHAAR